MKSKIKSKSNNHTINIKQDNIKIYTKNKQIKDRNIPKKIYPTIQKTSKTKINSKTTKKKLKKPLYNNIFNIEDSSTNCLSRNNNKRRNIIPKFNLNLIKKQRKEKYIIPLLISKESEGESLFINYKLGQNDSYTESTLRSDLKNYDLKNKKLNLIKNKYNHCNVDENIGRNENDSLELYDFSDKTNVDYVLRNLSALSCSRSGKDKSSINLDDCNEDESGNKKVINKIKIFNAKQSLSNITSKIK